MGEELTSCNGVYEWRKLRGREILDNVIIIRTVFVTISLDFINVLVCVSLHSFFSVHTPESTAHRNRNKIE